MGFALAQLPTHRMRSALQVIDGGDADPYASFASGNDDGVSVAIHADADAWDENNIPPRPWIVPGYLMRGAVTVLSGPGSAGKSMLGVLWCCALATGERIGRFDPHGSHVVLNYNVEDDHAEQQRRFSAALRQMRRRPSDIAGKVIRLWPDGIGTLFEKDAMTGALRATPAMETFERYLATYRPDVVIADPMVELHNAEENDNTSLRAVMAKMRGIAATYRCALALFHHSRKGVVGAAGDPDSLRGASSIVGAARVVLTVLTMDETEAEKIGIRKEERRSYFRLDGAKSNYAPIDEAEWFQRVEHQLDNGDKVAAAWPWKPPTPFHDTTSAQLNTALDRISQGFLPGQLYGPSRRGGSSRWCGAVLIRDLGIQDKQAASMIAAWLKSGLLYEVETKDERGRSTTGVMVDDAKRPS